MRFRAPMPGHRNRQPAARDASRPFKVVLASIPDAPIWPQLPANGLNEQMEVQYSEGIPRVVIDREKQRMYIDTTGDTSLELAEFYEKFLAEDLDSFHITPAFSKGIYAMEAALKRPAARARSSRCRPRARSASG